MKKKVIVSLLMLVGGIVLFFDSADAATVFSYDGTGIRNWDSKGRNNIAKGKKYRLSILKVSGRIQIRNKLKQ